MLLLSVLGLGLLSSGNALSVVNQDVKRSVFLTGEVVREEHLIKARFADEPAQPSESVPAELAEEIHENWFPNYVALVPPESANNLAGFDAALVEAGDTTSPLQITEITSEMQHCSR